MEDNYSFVKNFEDAKLYDLMPPISAELLNYLFKNVIRENDILADIGCGTGRLTKELLKNGNIVYAVDPDEDMLDLCKSNLHKNKNIIFVNGSDNKTNLEDKSVDFILVSQSLHRFDLESFKKECNRILKNKNNIVVMWNRVQYGKDIFKELLNALKMVYPNYKSRFGDLDEVEGSIYEMDANLYNAKELIGKNHFIKFFKNNYILNHEEFRKLILSFGIFPLNDNSNNSKLINEIDKNGFIKKIDKIFFKYAINGNITLPFEADLHFYKG